MADHLYLQMNTEGNREEYKVERNQAKDTVRKAHEESGATFICEIEHKLHGRQVLKHIDKSEKDTADLNIVSKHQ